MHTSPRRVIKNPPTGSCAQPTKDLRCTGLAVAGWTETSRTRDVCRGCKHTNSFQIVEISGRYAQGFSSRERLLVKTLIPCPFCSLQPVGREACEPTRP